MTADQDIRLLEPGPGDEYLQGLPPDEPLEKARRDAIRAIRAACAAAAPSFVRPQDTKAVLGERLDLTLTINHASDPRCQIRIYFGDGWLNVNWPGFDGTFGGWDWDPEVALIVEALLAGRNRQLRRLSFGRLVASETELWSEDGEWSGSRRWKPISRLPVRVLPLGRISQSCSISFDRRECVMATASSA